MPTDADLLASARAWLAADPDPTTRAELDALLQKNDLPELRDRFGAALEFGTAGLRGTLGAGPNRMNRAVVRRTTLGLCRYLKAQVPEVAQRGIVVGRDGRRMSPEFHADTCAVIAAEGIPVYALEGTVPTPLVAHAVGVLGAAAGVMVTASHNPPAYNGYKVYWGNGAQIIPPHDKGIAAAIDAVGPASGIALRSPAQRSGPVGEAAALYRPIPASLEEGYLRALEGLQLRRDVPRAVKVAYTPMHGVGNKLARAALARCGFAQVETVPEQAEPDGNFPTVQFPNPEEPGAMDRVIALAERMGADLAVANDPDADRLACAARDSSGKFVQLSGNEVGVLLGHYVLTEGKRDAKTLVVTTIVSSTQLGHIASELGVRYAETLTGFKWIANRALELERTEGLRFAFGYEEALGYTVGTVARDKDGIGAAVVLCELAAVCKAQGRTLLDELGRIQRRFGLFASAQKSLTLPGADGAAQIGAMMARLRSQPPARVAGLKVEALSDVKASTRLVGGKREHLALPPSDVLVFELERGARVVARPSGTEPKIKFYFELREPIAEGEEAPAARARAGQKLAELQAAFLAIAGA